jgi:hypothetical protein
VPSQRPNATLEPIFADLPHPLEILHLELGRLIPRLSTNDIHVPAPPSTFLSNLKSLTINSEQDTPLFLSALGRCINLEELQLVTRAPSMREGDGGQVVFPQVRTLKLGKVNLLRKSKYFGRIRFPSVVHLTTDYAFSHTLEQRD